MLLIGLTGGIGSGKSTVGDLFANLGTPVIDTDRIAREVVEPGQSGLEKIARTFGPEFLAPDGTLDRKALRHLVFTDPDKRLALEAILHPLIRARMEEKLAALDAPYAIVVIPLLLETGQKARVDRTLVVDIPLELQVTRTSRRDGQERKRIESIIAAQCSRNERLRAADDVVDNSGVPEALTAQVERLHRKYLHIAAEKNASH